MALLLTNRPYRLLFSASAISNLGDGISALAFPWLASVITKDPFLISLVAFAQRLPWLLFTLPAGALTDRFDRRTIMVQTDLFRCLLTCGVIAVILSLPDAGPTHALPPILALSALAMLLGTAEVLRDNAGTNNLARFDLTGGFRNRQRANLERRTHHGVLPRPARGRCLDRLRLANALRSGRRDFCAGRVAGLDDRPAPAPFH